MLGAERRPIERAPARKPGGAGRVRKKSPAEAGHKVIGSSSSTNCGPASQPLLSGRSETRAQIADKPAARTSSRAVGFAKRGPRQKKPRQEARLFRPPPGLPTWRSRKAPVGSPTPFNRAAGGWLLCRQRRKGPPKRGKLGGDACRPTPSSAHEGQSRSWAPEIGGNPRQNVEPSRWLCISACSPARDQAQLPSLGN